MGIFKRQPPPARPASLREDLPPSVGEGRIESVLDQAVRTGALDDVAGKGAPLSAEYLREGEGGFLMAKILKEQGFVPDWAVIGQAVDAADERLTQLVAEGRDGEAQELLGQRNQLVKKLNAAVPSPVLQRGQRRLASYRGLSGRASWPTPQTR